MEERERGKERERVFVCECIVHFRMVTKKRNGQTHTQTQTFKQGQENGRKRKSNEWAEQRQKSRRKCQKQFCAEFACVCLKVSLHSLSLFWCCVRFFISPNACL